MKSLLAGIATWIALVASLAAAPTETHSPDSGATINSLNSITVTFSEAVVGVDADNLVINSVAATGVTGSGTTYTFTFTQPAYGTVNVNWDPDNSISDSSGVAFVPSAPWTYNLVDNIPPTVASTAPAAGETLNAMTQAEVTFSEPVTNVVASDLLINGVATTSVQGSGAGVYVFSFTQPADGSITFSWAPGQGITDLAGNAFAGGSWTSTLNSTLPNPNVIISEFLADNVSYPGKTTMMDEDGDFSPWIELWNKGSTSVNLEGWSLTNDASNPGMWIFPSTTLGANQYMIVWASGKNRTTITGSNHYHTNFTLPWSGGYLALFPPALPRTTPATAFNPYPVQRGDVSYGYDPSGALKYFSPSTFGTANLASAIVGIADPVNYSVNSGYFDFPFNLVISTPDPGVTINYTTNGSVPTASNGTTYTGPINISTTTVLRVAAFSSTLLPSDTQTESFFFPSAILQQTSTPAGYPITFPGGQPNNTWTPTDQTLENGSHNYFQMDQTTVNDPTLYPDGPAVTGTTMRTNQQRIVAGFQDIPTVSIGMSISDLFDQNTGIYSHPESTGTGWERPDSMEVIYPDGSQSNQQVNSGIQIQGGTSRGPGHGFKRSFRLTFKDDYGSTKYSHSIFTDSPVSSFNTFVLDAGSNYWEIYDGGVSPTDQRQRGQGMRDSVTADMQNAMGWPSFHSRFINLYLNGLYWGLDYIHERPDDDWAASYFGGDSSQYNVYRDTTSGFEVVAGDTTSADWKSMFTNYITPVCNTSGVVTGTMTSANYQSLQQVLDVTAFADYMILNLYTGNSDWPFHNWYVTKKTTPDGRFRFVVWDAEYSFLSATTTSEFDNYEYSDHGCPGSIWGALRTNPEFRLLVADRIEKFFFNGGVFYVNPSSPGYDPKNPQNNVPAALYMNRVNEALNAIAGEYSKWGSYTALWPPSGGGGGVYTRNNQWITELNNLLGLQTTSGYTSNFFPTRSANVIGYFRSRSLFPATGINAPNYSQFGGRVVTGYDLTATLPAGSTAGGVIYYTTDGSDPRVYGSGLPATVANGGTALAYSAPGIMLNTAGDVEVKARALYSGTNWSAVTDATFSVGSPAVPLRITELMYDPSPGGSSGTEYEYLEIENAGSQTLDISGYNFTGIGYVFPPNTTIAPGVRLVLANNNNPTAWAARYPGVSVAGYYTSSLSNSGERIAIYDSNGKLVTSVTYGVSAPWPSSPAGGGPSLEVINPLGDPNDPANWQASAVSGGTPGLPNTATPSPSVQISEVLAKNASYPINGVVSDWMELYNTTGTTVDISGWKLSNSSNSYTFPASTTIASGSYLVVLCTKTNPNNGSLWTNFKISGGGGGDSLVLYDNSSPAKRIDGVSWGQQITDMSIANINGTWQLATPTPGAATTTPAALAPTPELVINEWLTNPLSGASIWFELYNPDPTLPQALQGLYAQTPTQLARFNALSFMPPASFIQIFADTNTGGNHLDFALPTTATTLSLLDPTGAVINTGTLDALASNISEGHLPDGAATAAVTFAVSTPGATNAQPAWTGPVWNEVMALDTLDGHPGWVELYNPTSSAYNLAGLKVGNSSSASSAWTIPAGTTIPANGYLTFWCDGSQPASTVTGTGMNTGFNLNGTSGGIYLFNATGQPVSQQQWGFQIPNMSIGVVSGGAAWNLLATPTPGAANSGAATFGSVSNLRINEWLASESSGNDWFELYNLSTLPVAMAGLYLTDDPSTTGQGLFQIAPLSFIAGNGFVEYQADGNPSLGSDHVNFKINSSGEYLQISADDGNYTPIDAVSFGIQTTDLSEGRVPDGGSTIESGLTPTPDASNDLPPPVPAMSALALSLLGLLLYIVAIRLLPKRAGRAGETVPA